jgi:hypothetical protein
MLDANNLQDLRKARGIVAELVTESDLLMPIFERLDNEVRMFEARTLTESRLQKLARRSREIRDLV